MPEQGTPSVELVEEMKVALHGVDKFLAMIIEQEPLSVPAVQKGKNLRAMLAKVLEKASSVGKRLTISSPPQVPIPLPPKPGAKPAAPAPTDDGDLEQEDYTEMDADQRPRLDTSTSLYLDMNASQQNSGGTQPLEDEFYTAMDSLSSSRGASTSGLPAASGEPIDEEFYTDMDTAAAGLGLTPNVKKLKEEDAGSFGSQEEYTEMDRATTIQEDVYEETEEALATPRPVVGTLPSKPSGNGTSNVDKPRSATMPVGHDDGDDDDPYGLAPNVQPVAAGSIVQAATQRGFLEKLGGATGKSWQKRYVVLHDLTLYFYQSGKDKRQRNQIALAGYTVSEATEHSTKKKPAFKLVPAQAPGKGKKTKKVYCFRANSSEERSQWIGALRAGLMSANRRSKSFLDSAAADDSLDNLGGVSPKNPEPAVDESFYEDPLSAPPRPGSTPTTAAPPQDEYLVPAEQLSGGSASSTISGTSNQAQEEYLVPEDVTRPSSTFNPYASRQQAVKKEPLSPSSVSNPYASRQQAIGDYMSRKQLQKLPPTPDQSNPYASRKSQAGLPPIPAPVAPVAPVAPTSRDYVDTMSIYVQKPDKPSFENIYVALWDYRASADDELSFKRGDLIFIEDHLNDLDWWVGVKKTPNDVEDFSGDRGLLVSAYVSPAYEKLI